ncbi:MAG TPA: hypothetical protein VJ599_00910 [Nitrososphaeraceae archaeon]|nr:hypothetical protein [Nitrososphaeraceae archaeon]
MKNIFILEVDASCWTSICGAYSTMEKANEAKNELSKRLNNYTNMKADFFINIYEVEIDQDPSNP